MCAFTVDLIDFEKLSEAQKKGLLKNLQKKKKTLETQLEDANKSLKGVNLALKKIEKKSKRRG
jgi:hypothetical protein